jgi:predicted polyphosphate/ATP-dependent NAD kinase
VSKVGIIANPAAGKDIRRLVAHASVVSNRDKANLLRRIVLGVDSTGVDEILIMPDYCGLGSLALAGLRQGKLRARVSMLEMPVKGTQDDSTAAATLMREAGVDCLVTLGGDGTNRAVAKGDCSIPLVAVSTGTNNVFPVMVEATTAGLAAGIIARGIVPQDDVVSTQKYLVLIEDGVERDLALVDAVVLDQPFVGARAIWDLAAVRQIVCTRAEPQSIGLSSIGGCIRAVSADDDFGLHLKLGNAGRRVRAPVLPGVIEEVCVEECSPIAIGDEVAVTHLPGLIALDGEREAALAAGHEIRIRLERNGPRTVDLTATIREAADRGFFISSNGHQGAR